MAEGDASDPLASADASGAVDSSDGSATEDASSPSSPVPNSPSPTSPQPILQARGIGKTYPTASGGLTVLDGLDLDVFAGELVAVVGESGTGKSTLLHLLGALDRPTAGTVTFRGEDVFAKGDEDLAAFRNRAIGFVFQFHHLLPEFTALENVSMPALIAGGTFESSDGRARQLLTTMGLGDRLDHRPSQLSGGEQQRVAVSRALMNEPGLVLMDEPTGNLDVNTAERLHDELLRLSRDADQAFVVVTHNPTLAALADRVLRLQGGRLVEERAEAPETPAGTRSYPDHPPADA
ncbi:MAG: ABC transporter ATP-binding protein [Bacteroidota bacterium]